MYIERHMTTPAVTVRPDTLLPEVKEIMTQRRIRHLPVVDDNNCLIGMITDRDLRSAYPSSVLEEKKRQVILDEIAQTQVQAIMSKELLSLTPMSTLDDALNFLERDKIGLLPVIDEEKHILGVFSVQDLMTAYKNLYGIGERGSALIAVEDDGQPKPMTRIVKALEEHQISFSRISRIKQGDKNVIYLRVRTFKLNAVHKTLQEIGMKYMMPGSKVSP